MDAQSRRAIDRHQTASDQDVTEWNNGYFGDGSKARIDGYGRQHAPSAEAVGAFAHRSWLAGWADADMGILADGLSETMPVTK